jgi:hypothetical protein
MRRQMSSAGSTPPQSKELLIHRQNYDMRNAGTPGDDTKSPKIQNWIALVETR